MPDDMSSPLKQTALDAAHRTLGARMAPFAGYAMPIQYEGVLAEHRWTREHAGLFDVSHMGPAWLILKDQTGDPEADHRAVSALIEPLIPGDIAGLARGRLRYSMLLNESGGIIDDLFVGRPGGDSAQGRLLLIVNAGTKDGDFALIEQAAGGKAALHRLDSDHSLLALQGPEAVAVLSQIAPAVADMAFMTAILVTIGGEACLVTRSGYTGEDGFEILVPNTSAVALWERLLSDERVKPVGLGARDSLRLEAGLPLYGHDLDKTVSPVEAGMGFAISKRRLEAGGVRGGERLAGERAGELSRVRVGLKVLEGAPAREGAIITDAEGAEVGVVTSGGFSPTLSAPIALGFVTPAFAGIGQALKVVVRGKPQSAEVCPLPFVPHRYVRKS